MVSVCVSPFICFGLGGGKMKAKDESQMGKRIGVEARLIWFSKCFLMSFLFSLL
ncbi:hypothetical protein PRUPE_6G326200 [Prunus persica]|uniref:Uncharacterized protein n=1 Tax=Prunus persica TaxID=3760 RepID=A0A251P2E0_PRUPE|nr:hypothetical protein PRUPE_6G326200 [Prunus persica]ONI04526.1 hypothetical protein PRUPE_6G326200 [Prunus persica]